MAVITFIGATHGVGVTMTAQSVAEMLARSGKDVVFLTVHDLEYMTRENNVCLDLHRSAITNDVLGQAELETALTQGTPNLRVMAGCLNPLEQRYYQPDVIKKLCAQLRRMTEYIVIDAGSNVDSGFLIGAVEEADTCIAVLTQQERAIARWKRNQDAVFAPLNMSFQMAVNLHVNLPRIYSVEQMEELLDLDCVGVIPDVEFGWQCETERTTLLALSKEYEKSIRSMTAKIANVELDSGNEKKGLLSGRRKGR